MNKGDLQQDEVSNEALDNQKSKIMDQIKNDPSLVLSWLGGLTESEQETLSALYQLNRACTINDIKIRVIVNSVHINGPDSRSYLKDCNFPFKAYRIIVDDGRLQNFKRLFKRNEKMKFIQEEISFPAFRKYHNSLQSLVSMGIVIKRESEVDEKVKGYFYLHPLIRNALDKIKNGKP